MQPHLDRTRLCELGDTAFEPKYLEKREALKALLRALAQPKVGGWLGLLLLWLATGCLADGSGVYGGCMVVGASAGPTAATALPHPPPFLAGGARPCPGWPRPGRPHPAGGGGAE